MSSTHVITSLQHPIVKHLVKLRTSSEYRHEQQKFLLEGIKPIRENLEFVSQLFFTAPHHDFVRETTIETWEVTDAILRKISGMPSPEGIIGEVRMPSFVPLAGSKKSWRSMASVIPATWERWHAQPWHSAGRLSISSPTVAIFSMTRPYAPLEGPTLN